MALTAIYARAANGVIGRDGALPSGLHASILMAGQPAFATA